MMNKTALLSKRASDIAALKTLISTKVQPTVEQATAFEQIANARTVRQKIPASVQAVADSFDPNANSSFENTTGFLFAMVLELADAVAALQTAAPTAAAPVLAAPVVTAPVVTAPVVTAPVVTAPVVTAPVVEILPILQ